MHVAAELETLRGNWPAQRRADGRMEQAVRTWWAGSGVAGLKDELARYAEGRELNECPGLTRLTADGDRARSVCAALIEALCAALREEPLGQVPFRHQASEGGAMLQISQSGGAALTLVAYDGLSPRAPAEAIAFSDSEGCELVLAGAAELRVADLVAETARAARIDYEPRHIAAGERFDFTPHKARIVERVHGSLVLLRLARTAKQPGPSRSFRMADGALLHRASGDRGESHRELAMALLGRMRRGDAAPLLAELSREGSEHFRWQALRECLALDTAQGFAALARIAADATDPLGGPAAALRAQLIARYPQLERIEAEPCPA
ncbi:MAG: hypothetical protein WC692_01925 [Erythrobacter sp.]